MVHLCNERESSFVSKILISILLCNGTGTLIGMCLIGMCTRTSYVCVYVCPCIIVLSVTSQREVVNPFT